VNLAVEQFDPIPTQVAALDVREIKDHVPQVIFRPNLQQQVPV
jgi:hypothetical protein